MAAKPVAAETMPAETMPAEAVGLGAGRTGKGGGDERAAKNQDAHAAADHRGSCVGHDLYSSVAAVSSALHTWVAIKRK
jgi:hypothetical protein